MEFFNMSVLELSEKLPQLRENVKKLNDRFMALLNINPKMQKAKAGTKGYTSSDNYRYFKLFFRKNQQLKKYKELKNVLENKKDKKDWSKGKFAALRRLFKRLSTWGTQYKEAIDEDQELIPLDLFDVSCDTT